MFLDVSMILEVIQKNSRAYFIDDMYFCDIDQIYLYKNEGDWKSFGDRCFIKTT